MIPKRIHQTHSHANDLNDAHRANIESLRRLNPGWDYRLYDDEACRDFIRAHYDRRLLDLYDRVNPDYGSARADLFRYLLMYEQGGVYLDIKSGLQRPLDSVLQPDDAYLLAHWKNAPGDTYAGWGLWPEITPRLARGEYVNWFIIAEPRHPYLERVVEYVAERIEHYVAARDGVGKRGVLRTTGPIPYTLAIEAIRSEHPHRLVEYADLGLVYSIFETAEDVLAHTRHGRRHYSTLTEPLISLPPAAHEAQELHRWRPVGRNEPCPCGSGKKYKHCHGML
jgi:mannosyltransferase OCH1-like enzyme